ncbi:DUF4197 domain-containing protein [Daejeonia sp. YH14]|uniref:DUF4197 domain-containing protein n=1 Tax=Daejeonia sp. YH14 TaxID=3439042 RepID=UPI003F49A6E1
MKKTFLLMSGLFFTVSSHAQILDVLKSTVINSTGVYVNKITSKTGSQSTTSAGSETVGSLTSSEISSGLKEALSIGVQEGVKKLSAEDGFYKNSLVKILMPEKLRNIENKLRLLGMGSLADKGVKLMNRAAEDAVTDAAPIFASAITSMTISDAKGILLGNDNAATNYLQNKTQSQLFTTFEPKVKASLGKVGADTVWKQIISKYNLLTGQNVTADLNDYVTTETVNGVFKMVAEKESGIRNNSALRTTSLLKKVFGAKN